MMSALKSSLILNAKNLIGWRTKRKIVVISVDDYGNVRLNSKKAREAMSQAGLKVYSRFDAYDTLETRQDLEELYSVLTSVKDKHGRHAIFTPFAMPCNIDFETMEKEGYDRYRYEHLPQTYGKLEALQPDAYNGAWALWKEGMGKGLMIPLFHGREHLNLKLFEEKLQRRDHEVMTALKNRSYTSISSDEYSTMSAMAAFDFWEFDENERFHNIIQDGLDQFEKVYEYRSDHFNPPGGREHPVIHSTLKECGVKYIDTPLFKTEHQGNGKFKKVFNYTGKKNREGQMYLVRNVVFEPTENRSISWVDFTMKQIEAAFRWNRPAIISSHRVNYCGHIVEANRKKGLDALQRLLHQIVKKWPDVEFMAANELGDIITNYRD